MTEWILVQERYKNSPFPVYFIAEVMTREMKQFAGRALHKCVVVQWGPHLQFWLQAQKWNALQQACLERVLADPALVARLVRKFRQKTPAFLAFVKKLHGTDWTKKKNSELWKAYEQYCLRYKEIGVLGEPFALSVKDALAAHLEKDLKKQLAEKGLEKKFSEYFSALVSPAVPSFASREQLDLLRLAVKAKRKGIKAVRKELEKHCQDFFWLPYDYEGETWGTAYFESVLKELLEKPALNLEGQLERQRTQFRALRQKQARIIRETGLNSRQQELFSALRHASMAMDFKKEVLTQSHFYKNAMMREIGRRLRILFSRTYFLRPEEVENALLGNKLDRAALSERERFSVSVCQNGFTRIETGENARAWVRKLKEAKETRKSKELQGQCASPGSAIGRARVLLNSSQIKDMQEGEILVVQATTPDFVPAMKKAKAIVTNEGGITSHAAIVSRELGVPCIVGTENATKLLKTGDLIDVHAASGIIKKIESQKRASK